MVSGTQENLEVPGGPSQDSKEILEDVGKKQREPPDVSPQPAELSGKRKGREVQTRSRNHENCLCAGQSCPAPP